MKYLIFALALSCSVIAMEPIEKGITEVSIARTPPTATTINRINVIRATYIAAYYFHKHMYDKRFMLPGDMYAVSLYHL